jgi:folate-binding protein YgfZ
MASQPNNEGFTCRLDDRCLLKVSGDDAASFLQNLVTNDIFKTPVYACLLTPQGRFLHDLFITRDGDDFFLECETARREDLMRRLKFFTLRSKTILEDCHSLFDVYATTEKTGFADPRLPELGHRFYLPRKERLENTAARHHYSDLRIRLGVPEGSDMKPEIDVAADVNLDKLNAVSWDKGCFVGQEVTARMNHRGLVKKRLVIVSGESLKAGESLLQEGRVVGEVRAVNSTGNQGLAVLKLDALSGTLPVATTVPEYL